MYLLTQATIRIQNITYKHVHCTTTNDSITTKENG